MHKKGHFMIDGKKSADYNLFIQRTPLIETPARRVELRNAFGVHGGVPYDERAYDNTEMQLLMFIDGIDINYDRSDVDDLLRNTGVFKEFVPYWDTDKIYYVMNMGKTQYESPSWYGQKQALQTTFTVKPYKYLRNTDGQNDRTFDGYETVDFNNPFSSASQPLIIISGMGDATIVVNGLEYVIQNIDEFITVDCERYIAYKENYSGFIENQNSKYMQKEFPIFLPGENTIEVFGTSVDNVTVSPRWRSLT